jgi:peptide/nickel transport system ATP-binding protein
VEKLADTKELYTNFYTFEGVVKALNGVSIHVNKGETYGLVGESGCGKSVTVRSMMRIVQAPGRIESGQIHLFFSEEQRDKAIDIVGRSEAFMQTIRGNDISMIFQEASSSLNPVLSIGEQVGESFQFHRMPQMLEETEKRLSEDINAGKGLVPYKKMIRGLMARERAVYERHNRLVLEIDEQLYRLEEATDASDIRKREALKRHREHIRKKDPLVQFASHVPFFKRYRKRIAFTIRVHVIELLRQLGVPNPDNVVDRYPHELSGGMQQRIVIAIALACHPRMLIADEPTSNLDVTIQAQILDLIKKLKETLISSVLFITHDLGVVAEVCDRVTVMYAGDAVETAEVKELFKNPLHPYTKGLMNSVPKVEQEGALQTIPGTVPNLIHPPTGCRFHPRCPYAMDICKKEKPVTIEHSKDHFVACHLFTGEKHNER